MGIKQSNKKNSKQRKAAVTTLALLLACVMFTTSDIPAYAASSLVTSSPFSGTKYSKYYHNGRFRDYLIVNGVDISYWQSLNSNWKTAREKGMDFAILRITYSYYSKSRITPDNDSKFESHYAAIKDEGIMKGLYIYSQAKNEEEASVEAEYAVKRMKELGIEPGDLELPVYMDYEFSPNIFGRLRSLNKTNGTAAAKAFCEIIRNAGYRPGLYASKNFLVDYIDTAAIGSDVDIWVAQYANKCSYTGNYSTWQYSSEAKIGSGKDGILSQTTNKVSATDVNFMYVDKTAGGGGDFAIYTSAAARYTGGGVLPELYIYCGNKKLKAGRDYITAGIRNISKSSDKAYAYIRGIGNYSGYALVPFTIGSGYITRLGLSKCSGAAVREAADGTYGLKFGTADGMRFVRNVPAGTTSGELLADLTCNDSFTLKIITSKGKIKSDTSRLLTGNMIGVYKGSNLKGTIDILVDGDTENGLSAVNLAKAQAAKVLVRKTSIKKLTAAKNAFTVKVSKVTSAYATGYQVRYSTKKNMSEPVIAAIGESNTDVSEKITGLESGTAYYVQVRTYKVVNGEKYLSSWSTKSKITTK